MDLLPPRSFPEFLSGILHLPLLKDHYTQRFNFPAIAGKALEGRYYCDRRKKDLETSVSKFGLEMWLLKMCLRK